MVDALSFISPSVSQLISSSFNRIYRYTPGLFSRGYRYAEAHPGMFRDGTLVDRAITAGWSAPTATSRMGRTMWRSAPMSSPP